MAEKLVDQLEGEPVDEQDAKLSDTLDSCDVWFVVEDRNSTDKVISDGSEGSQSFGGVGEESDRRLPKCKNH